jgi:hypothetical protein
MHKGWVMMSERELGRIEVPSRALPYSALDDNQQPIIHAAITENKRLSEELA